MSHDGTRNAYSQSNDLGIDSLYSASVVEDENTVCILSRDELVAHLRLLKKEPLRL
jgi:hypothetical protein